MLTHCRQVGNSSMIEETPLRIIQHRFSIMHQIIKGER